MMTKNTILMNYNQVYFKIKPAIRIESTNCDFWFTIKRSDTIRSDKGGRKYLNIFSYRIKLIYIKTLGKSIKRLLYIGMYGFFS